MTDIRDYKKDIKIDTSNLEDEWIKQPSLYLYYADAHAEALRERDLWKARLEYTYAKRYSSIKKDWEKYFDSKPTEAAIKEYILSLPAFKKIEAKYIEACYYVNTMLAAKTAFDQRKVALQNLVQLRISGFYAEPKAPQRSKMSIGHKIRKSKLNKK
jgi:hypothetical protein